MGALHTLERMKWHCPFPHRGRAACTIGSFVGVCFLTRYYLGRQLKEDRTLCMVSLLGPSAQTAPGMW